MTHPDTNIVPFPFHRTRTVRSEDTTNTGVRAKAPPRIGDATGLTRAAHSARDTFLLRQDLALYHSLEAFRNANSVLELGCGAGDHLRTLARQFPEKRFAGADANETNIRRALADGPGANIEYHHASIKTMHPDDWAGFDLVIVRCQVRDQPCLTTFLERSAALLENGAHLLIYEECEARTTLFPEIPERVAANIELDKLSTGIVGASAARLVARDAWRHGFALVAERNLVHPAVGPDECAALGDVLAHNIAQRVTEELEEDIHLAIQGIRRWSNTPGAYGQLGTRAILLKRRTAGVYSRRR